MSFERLKLLNVYLCLKLFLLIPTSLMESKLLKENKLNDVNILIIGHNKGNYRKLDV